MSKEPTLCLAFSKAKNQVTANQNTTTPIVGPTMESMDKIGTLPVQTT